MVRKTKSGNPETITLRVQRENPAQHVRRRYDTFQIPPESGMTVLGALLYAKEQVDHSIAIRFSCRMAACGSCGMKINGLPRLACYTQLTEFGNSTITVEPLDHYPLVRPSDRLRRILLETPVSFAIPYQTQHGRTGDVGIGIFSNSASSRRFSTVLLLHKVRPLQLGMPYLGHRPSFHRSASARAGIPIHHRYPR